MRDKYYFVPGDKDVPPDVYELGVDMALSTSPDSKPFNLIKVDWQTKSVSLLLYEGLGERPHPYLKSSVMIGVDGTYSITRKYGDNPPILHRTELILPGEWPEFVDITTKEELAGMYDEQHRNKIGYKKYWNELCHKKGMAKSLVKD